MEGSYELEVGCAARKGGVQVRATMAIIVVNDHTRQEVLKGGQMKGLITPSVTVSQNTMLKGRKRKTEKYLLQRKMVGGTKGKWENGHRK